METRPGYLTSEWLLTIFLEIGLSLNTLNIWNFIPEHQKWVSVLAQALIAGCYSISRGYAKANKSFDRASRNAFRVFPRWNSNR